jgi:hypothetical protein
LKRGAGERQRTGLFTEAALVPLLSDKDPPCVTIWL